MIVQGGTKVEAKKAVQLLMCLGLAASLILGASAAKAADKGPIKIGLLLPYTGTMPLQAKGVTNGAELYFDQMGKKIGGRTVEIIKEDTELNPTTGLTKARRLVEQQKVDFIIGPVSSAVALAIHDYLRKAKVIQINPTAFTRELTSPQKASPNIFRVCDTTDQNAYPMGKWMYKNTPYRNIVIAGSDFAAGHHSLEAFKAGFEASGGKIIKEVYPKMGTMDFAPFLATIDTKGADAVFCFFAGTDAVRFVQQYQEFGLKKRLPLYGHATMVDDPYLPAIGEPGLGIISSGHYSFTIDTPVNKAFVKAYTAKYNETPSRYSEFGYTAAQMIGAAAEALKGDLDDTKKVSDAIRKAAPKIETPSGPLAFDQYNQRVVNMYVLKTEKKDGKLVNSILDKMGKVSQEDVWGWWNK
jgi:branched-chain amino acid transport system substrate-binding protein